MKRILVIALAIVLCGNANATVLKIATLTPEASQWMKDMRASATEIKDRTEGRVQIKYYGNGIKGNDSKVLGLIRIRSLQGGAFTPSALGSRYPDINIYGLPLVFNSEEEASYVRERMDERLQQGLEQAGWVNFGFSGAGFAMLMSNTPVNTLEDMRGKRVWVPEGDTISYKSMEALDLSPVTLPLTDVLTGLQTGLIDIIAIPPLVALVMQWHTKVDYITEFPLVYTFGLMAVEKKSFDKISAADQEIVREVMSRTYQNFDSMNLEDSIDALQALKNSGIESVPFDESEFDRIRDVLNDSNRALGEKGEFSIELYDEMIGHLEDFRRDTADDQSAAAPVASD